MKTNKATNTTAQATEVINQPKTTRNTCSKLRCIVTNRERLTNKAYLTSKAAAAGLSVSDYLGFYVSRQALKLLRAGKTLDEVRKDLGVTYNEPISADLLAKAIKVNGKWGKAESAE
jgi:hypothetical protein